MQTFKLKTAPLICFGSHKGHFSCKFNRIAKLASMYQPIYAKLDAFIDTRAFTERSLCALAVKIMMHTGIRIGNEDSAEGYESKRTKEVVQTFGLTTLKRSHVKVMRNKVRFEFLGKRCVEQNITINDPVLVKQIASLVKRGKELHPVDFLPVSDYEVRKFVSKSIGKGFKPKDFRTLYANQVFSALHTAYMREEKPRTKSEAKKEVKQLITTVAAHLGNTPAMAKRAYLDGRLLEYHIAKRYENQRLKK